VKTTSSTKLEVPVHNILHLFFRGGPNHGQRYHVQAGGAILLDLLVGTFLEEEKEAGR